MTLTSTLSPLTSLPQMSGHGAFVAKALFTHHSPKLLAIKLPQMSITNVRPLPDTRLVGFSGHQWQSSLAQTGSIVHQRLLASQAASLVVSGPGFLVLDKGQWVLGDLKKLFAWTDGVAIGEKVDLTDGMNSIVLASPQGGHISQVDLSENESIDIEKKYLMAYNGASTEVSTAARPQLAFSLKERLQGVIPANVSQFYRDIANDQNVQTVVSWIGPVWNQLKRLTKRALVFSGLYRGGNQFVNLQGPQTIFISSK